MEPKIIETKRGHFIIQFKNDGKGSEYNYWWSGKVVQIYKFDDGGFIYHRDDSSSATTVLEDARVWFEWSFMWRGVWEGRVSFIDDEFWHEELETIPEIWKQIESIVKERIQSDNPNDNFEE